MSLLRQNNAQHISEVYKDSILINEIAIIATQNKRQTYELGFLINKVACAMQPLTGLVFSMWSMSNRPLAERTGGNRNYFKSKRKKLRKNQIQLKEIKASLSVMIVTWLLPLINNQSAFNLFLKPAPTILWLHTYTFFSLYLYHFR